MNAAANVIEDKIDELLTVLDEDIRHIENSLSWLNELRTLVIRRDDAALQRLLESMRIEVDSYASNESRRRSIRKELAVALGCRCEEVTLSGLEPALPQEKAEQVTYRKTVLKKLIEQIKKEYRSTTLLLLDCARFNNLLLRAVFDLGKAETVYYNSDGAARRRTDTSLLNMRF